MLAPYVINDFPASYTRILVMEEDNKEALNVLYNNFSKVNPNVKILFSDSLYNKRKNARSSIQIISDNNFQWYFNTLENFGKVKDSIMNIVQASVTTTYIKKSSHNDVAIINPATKELYYLNYLTGQFYFLDRKDSINITKTKFEIDTNILKAAYLKAFKPDDADDEYSFYLSFKKSQTGKELGSNLTRVTAWGFSTDTLILYQNIMYPYVYNEQQRVGEMPFIIKIKNRQLIEMVPLATPRDGYFLFLSIDGLMIQGNSIYIPINNSDSLATVLKKKYILGKWVKKNGKYEFSNFCEFLKPNYFYNWKYDNSCLDYEVSNPYFVNSITNNIYNPITNTHDYIPLPYKQSTPTEEEQEEQFNKEGRIEFNFTIGSCIYNPELNILRLVMSRELNHKIEIIDMDMKKKTIVLDKTIAYNVKPFKFFSFIDFNTLIWFDMKTKSYKITRINP